ncbi:MAG TPA: Lrp/AsnC family transcriptional regulator [Nitrososphaeraceae archaeon]|jgi:Lrp/AsnC family transcriptional regulator for asnA, asnC and gidA|nr:Lrp/AsnC family transcriptional regulator [Nitrososphaeraceae archaeon]HSF49660.1 Lrp/AsnC family transcriptional regulator [Nitrososphaeraceae archaeon]
MSFKQNILDYVNYKIIDVLSKNSSLPFVELAKQIGISDATVHTRVKKMISTGIIKKFSVIIDNNLVGYDHLAFIMVKLENGKTDQAVAILEEIEQILEIHEIYDKFDLLVKIRSKSLENMRDIIVNKILSITEVKEIELMTVLRTRKEEQMVSLRTEISEKSKDFF